MLVHRLYLRNYRVYEDELDLHLPAGLVGIYGPNGGGKSALIESIRWTLWGKARTGKNEVRTSGVNGDCITEVEFEHEGHLYLVRRVITGINDHVKAEVHADGAVIAESVTDVRRYLESILGMDDAAFRASVFAEQKQVASFTNESKPEDRRKLVLSLLGITPLGGARDLARKDAKEAEERHHRLRALLPELEALEANAEQAAAAAEASEIDANAEAAVATAAKAEAEAAQAAVEALEDLRAEYERVVADGRAARDEAARAGDRVTSLTAELEGLAQLETREAQLQPVAAGLDSAEERLRLLVEVERATAAVAAITVTEAPAAPEPDRAEDAAQAAADAAAALAQTTGLLDGAREHVTRARAALDRAADASGDDMCPTCGQALGDAFAQVQAHRQTELADAEARVAALEAALSERRLAATAAAAAARAAADALKTVEETHRSWQHASTARAGAQAGLDTLLSTLDRAPVPGELDTLRVAVVEARAADKALNEIRGRLTRRPQAEQELQAETAARDDASRKLTELRDKVRSIGFDEAGFAAAKAARDDRRAVHDKAAAAAQQSGLIAERARGEASRAGDRLAVAREQHDQLADLAIETVHLKRIATLLHEFRDTVINAIGPRLSTQAAELFAELTDHEYEHLEVDPESYDIRIHDKGRAYGMSRFSGSETDLANLALRVAISEHVKFQSGGAVGLLVLDEVFGPLDADRKERMINALERLKARFRQVLVVTHDIDIKEQLPSAIEVIKLPGRRATAQLVTTGA